MTHKPIAGNTNTGLLKWLALIFMFLDHAGKMCFPGVPEMRILGRIAFPLYCWCLV
ncbi:MAG: fimbrial assembly protein, partial [Clostridia bacterium]|nr:fimbrial assembly protein [Clostridia bacterium]